MLRPRLIPSLLIHNGGLVKTIGFRNGKYVGDPINTVRIFNEKEVDELIVMDIDATVQSRAPDFETIAKLASECRMPLCYAGGVNSVAHAERIIGLGVEKIAISAAAVARPQLITEIADQIGRQSVVVVLDVKKTLFGKYQVFTHNGTRKAKLDPCDFARTAESHGAGEILVNSIDNDGRMEGYDLSLISQVRDAIDLPMTCLGGAGSLEDVKQVIQHHEVIGAAAGSLFVFKGKYRAVLVNYPSRSEKKGLFLNEDRSEIIH